MDLSNISNKKMAIIKTTWEYLLRKGLSCASIGELCKETKLAQSSLYYWFDNKYDIWISAGKYGISKVVDALFLFTFSHVDNVRLYFDTLLDEVDKYKHELRLAIQITTSPLFGKTMRDKTIDFNILYEEYGGEIMKVFGCSKYQAEIFIYSIIAFVVDYAIWDDKHNSQMLLENLYDRIAEALNL